MRLAGFGVGFADHRQLRRFLQGEQAGADAVVEVVVVVGDVVGERGGLGFGGGVGREFEIVQAVVGLDGRGGATQGAVVLGEAFQGFPGEVQAVEAGVTLFEQRDGLEALGVVVEAAIGAHLRIERLLAGVAERRVAEVVGERQGFGQVLVEPQAARQGAGDLRHLDGVGQAGAEAVAFVEHEDLGLVLEASEGAGMDDPVAVAAEGRAGVVGLRVEAAARRLGADGRGGAVSRVAGCEGRSDAPRLCAFRGLGGHGRRLPAGSGCCNAAVREGRAIAYGILRPSDAVGGSVFGPCGRVWAAATASFDANSAVEGQMR